jgi:hypothetical protein
MNNRIGTLSVGVMEAVVKTVVLDGSVSDVSNLC